MLRGWAAGNRPLPGPKLAPAGAGSRSPCPRHRRWHGSSYSTRLYCVRWLGPHRLFLSARTVLVSAHNGAVNHGILIVGFSRQVLKYRFPHLALCPAAPAPMHVFPVSKALGQVAPGHPGAIAVEHRFHKQPVVRRRAAHMADAARQQVPDPLPLIITQSIRSRHGFMFATKSRKRSKLKAYG